MPSTAQHDHLQQDGHLEIAVNEGNAAALLGVGTGVEVIVTTRSPNRR